MRVYIESTVPSYIVGRSASNVEQKVLQEVSRNWWETQRQKHELFVSEVVHNEILKGDKEMAAKRSELISQLRNLEMTANGLELAEGILSSGLLPKTAVADASHIALASVHNMDILLSWNLRHIANAAIQARLMRLVQDHGSSLPVICTPHQFFT